jgi:hypothetical protein
VDWLVEANVSEKHAVSIFRAEVTSALKMEIATNPHSILTQKNIIGIVTSVKILNLTSHTKFLKASHGEL